jgi:GNAT superfamily N-acetyltransferase
MGGASAPKPSRGRIRHLTATLARASTRNGTLPPETLMTAPITIHPIDFARDEAGLRAFLTERDQMRLDHSRSAVRDGDCYIFVAEENGGAVGWVVVHTAYRDDQDWDPPDDDTRRFQSGDNAYFENLEVTAGVRGNGVGARLLEAAQDEAKARGKRTLWLHTSENNTKAHKLFDREGWVHDRSVFPPWRPNSRTRIYRKDV